jgi:VIT1/CCC1 family predicted Fe2+/Mn2+ transporter
MPRPTYGLQVKARAKRLFMAIVAFAQGELEGVEQVPIQYSWQTETPPTLIVRTTLRALVELCQKDGIEAALSKVQIREALHRMEDFLNILEDVRERQQGKEDWHFKLTLWSKDTTENVNQFDHLWETKRPPKSREQQTAQPDSTLRVPTPQGGIAKQENRESAKGVQTEIRERGKAYIADQITIYESGSPSSRFGKPLQMPPLPDYFVERPEPQDAMKHLLLRDDRDAPATLVVSAIYGLGGIGKSVLAAWLAHDAKVQERFCDGILWATLGQEPDILSFLCDWIQALGDRDFKPTTIASASSHLRTLLYDKRVLLVVDDAWNPEHVEPFRVGRSGCRVLVTTRETSIANAKRYDLEEMKAEQSLELLTKKYPRKLIAQERSQAAQLAEEVGHLPLALELAAAQIEDGATFSELLEDLQAETARLESLDRPVEVSAAYRKRYSLLASLNLSVQRLSPEQQRQFAWLGILPEDVLVTEQVAATLWEMTPRQAGTALRILRSRALLLAGAQQQGQKPTYRIHDLMHDLAKRLLTGSPEPEYEQDLPGLGLALPTAHAQFVQRYRAQAEQGLWHMLEEDGYIHSHLTWHLEQAGQINEIHALLKERTATGRNGWFVACEALGQTANFVTDVARAWKWADKQCEIAPVKAVYWQCRYLLIYGSLNSLASNIPPELIAALIEKGLWKPIQGLAYVQQIPEASRRAEGIGAISSYLPEELMGEALEVARQIQNEFSRAWALSALVPHLPEELMGEALEVARQIQDESYHARALSALVPHLPEELMGEALEVARQIQDESYRARALSALVPHLPEELMGEALEVARQIQDESYHAQALSALVPHLPEELMGEALEVARQIQNESDRAQALSALVPHLPEELMGEALEVACQIQDESYRARALSALVPHLPQTLLDESLRCVKEMRDPYYKAIAFQGFALQFTHISTTSKFWSDTLHVFSALHRKEVMSTLANLNSFLSTLGGSVAVKEIVRAMQEMCQEWQ